jgi:hypothetical protein
LDAQPAALKGHGFIRAASSKYNLYHKPNKVSFTKGGFD